MADPEGQTTVGFCSIFWDLLAFEVSKNLTRVEAVSQLFFKWQGNVLELLSKELHKGKDDIHATG